MSYLQLLGDQGSLMFHCRGGFLLITSHPTHQGLLLASKFDKGLFERIESFDLHPNTLETVAKENKLVIGPVIFGTNHPTVTMTQLFVADDDDIYDDEDGYYDDPEWTYNNNPNVDPGVDPSVEPPENWFGSFNLQVVESETEQFLSRRGMEFFALDELQRLPATFWWRNPCIN